ncbi:hypothetical protein [Plantibacter flavus]|uniref:hypothetical protein n=1 Tax=Plantibacter flavus TaxID=150123 RepID=UPI0013566E9F|nr:hypothetical protein [Plantibacter flavus]
MGSDREPTARIQGHIFGVEAVHSEDESTGDTDLESVVDRTPSTDRRAQTRSAMMHSQLLGTIEANRSTTASIDPTMRPSRLRIMFRPHSHVQ